MKKKIRKLVLIIVIALTIIITGGVIAYLTDTDNATNTFTVGSVSIDLTEDNWDEINGQNVTPGKVIAKDPAINNTGKNPAYVYLKVENPKVYLSSGGAQHGLLSYSINDDWKLLKYDSNENYEMSIYYYKTYLDAGESTSTLFNDVTVNDYSQEYTSGRHDMIVIAYAIQSNHLPTGMNEICAYTLINDSNSSYSLNAYTEPTIGYDLTNNCD